MTLAEMNEARRWTALRGWRWMPGMRAVTPMGDFAGRLTEATLGIARPIYPDITDPATQGCLLALFREITGTHVHVVYIDGDMCRCMYWMRGDDGRWAAYSSSGTTETAALLAACERHEGSP